MVRTTTVFLTALYYSKDHMKTQEEFLTDFHALKNTDGILIGIDYGNKRIGLAVTDTKRQMAFAFKTIEKLAELDEIVADRKPIAFVIGMPYEPDGGEGFMVHQVRLFSARIMEKYALPVYFWDERDTSSEATYALYQAGAKGKKHKQHLDAHAAAIILQRALEALDNR